MTSFNLIDRHNQKLLENCYGDFPILDFELA